MRIFAVIGLVTGIMLVCAPLVLPRLGIGVGDTRSVEAGLPGKTATSGGGMAALWAMLPTGGNATSQGLTEAAPAAGMAGLAAALGDGGGLGGGMVAAGNGKAPSTDQLCAAMALSGQMSAADCKAQFGPGGMEGMMSEVQRAMDAHPGSSGRPGVRPQAKRPGPGAKFVKVGD